MITKQVDHEMRKLTGEEFVKRYFDKDADSADQIKIMCRISVQRTGSDAMLPVLFFVLNCFPFGNFSAIISIM